MRDRPTRFGFPPERPAFEPFPRQVPWETAISELGWCLDVGLGKYSTRYPLRLLAAEFGWQLTLRQVIARLRRHGNAPDYVYLIPYGGFEMRRSQGVVEGVHFHVLAGPSPELSR